MTKFKNEITQSVIKNLMKIGILVDTTKFEKDPYLVQEIEKRAKFLVNELVKYEGVMTAEGEITTNQFLEGLSVFGSIVVGDAQLFAENFNLKTNQEGELFVKIMFEGSDILIEIAKTRMFTKFKGYISYEEVKDLENILENSKNFVDEVASKKTRFKSQIRDNFYQTALEIPETCL